MLYGHSRGALCALLTLPGGPMCWGFPYFEIEKLANLHFMLFDRYEMHIQDFEDFVWGSSSLPGARLHICL